MQEDLQREEFRNILFELATTEFSLKNPASKSMVYQRLERLYHVPNGDNYRHFYSDVFIVLTTIHQGDRPGSIDVLGQNLAEIRKGYQPKNVDVNGATINIKDELKKLYDHVSLDIARILYSEGADWRLSGEASIGEIKSQLTVLQDDIKKAQGINLDFKETEEKVNEVEEKLKDAQKEYIAILGIFAAIVLTFTGGIAFSTSVLQNMHTVSAYRIIFVASLIGIVLLCALYGLFYYVDRIVNGNENQEIRPLKIGTIFLAVIMVVTFSLWLCGTVEERDAQIADTNSPQIEQQVNYQNQGQ